MLDAKHFDPLFQLGGISTTDDADLDPGSLNGLDSVSIVDVVSTRPTLTFHIENRAICQNSVHIQKKESDAFQAGVKFGL
jgi:hypothetical protein